MTQEPPSEDLIRYDVMVQDALLGVVRKVLIDAARQGLPGDHHFYITFRSEAPGVRLSTRLREKYPDEMTIVLQHQFWDLAISEHGFEVGLSFGGVPERLLVPFDALTGFYDPSVQFGLKFTPDETLADNDSAPEAGEPSVKDQLAAIATLEKSGKGKRGAASEPKVEPPTADAPATAEPSTPRKPRAKGQPGKITPEKPAVEKLAADKPSSADPAEKPAGGAEVVSLEAFRKKK
jgi:hypothetical protein